MAQILQSLKKYLNKRNVQTHIELPQGIRTGLASYLTPGEEVLFSIRNYRAIYKAPRWADSNTFFNSWFILTNSRIIIARNSSSFKTFRDIPHNRISQIHYETEALESRLIIHSPNTVDKIEFAGESKRHCEDLDQRINKVLEEAQKGKEHSGIFNTTICPHCKSRIPKESKFCSECGARL
jgi:ribosomal protein L40E